MPSPQTVAMVVLVVEVVLVTLDDVVVVPPPRSRQEAGAGASFDFQTPSFLRLVPPKSAQRLSELMVSSMPTLAPTAPASVLSSLARILMILDFRRMIFTAPPIGAEAFLYL